MATGTLMIQTTAARQSSPIADVDILITGDGFTQTLFTDAEGNSAVITVKTPACRYSLEEDNDSVLPYATVTLTARKEGYREVVIEGVQIFPNQLTLVPIDLVTDAGEAEDIPDDPTVIPVHALFNGTGGSGPEPIENCSGGGVLNEVVVPNKITVHLGKPAASARNVTVSFQNYIANVASSEVYPTWVGRDCNKF